MTQPVEESWTAFNEITARAADIQHTTELATADIDFAQGRIDIAVSMTASLAATKTTINAWNPSATYKASDLVAIKGQLVNIIDQLSTITTALNELYKYRKANDQSTIDINNALIWMAKKAVDNHENHLIP